MKGPASAQRKLLVTPAEFIKASRVPGVKSLPGVRSQVSAAVVRSADAADDAPLKFIMSTARRDRADDVVQVAGWNTSDFEKNPVMLWAHDYSAMSVGRIGKVLRSSEALLGEDVTFPERDLYEFGWLTGQMYRRGFLNAVSVGFQPDEWKYSEEGNGIIFVAQSLLELSAVPVPMNPDALQGAKSAGLPMGTYEQWLQQQLDGKEPTVARGMAEAAWRVLRAPQVQSAGTPAPAQEPAQDDEPTDVELLGEDVQELRSAVVELTAAVKASAEQNAVLVKALAAFTTLKTYVPTPAPEEPLEARVARAVSRSLGLP